MPGPVTPPMPCPIFLRDQLDRARPALEQLGKAAGILLDSGAALARLPPAKLEINLHKLPEQLGARRSRESARGHWHKVIFDPWRGPLLPCGFELLDSQFVFGTKRNRGDGARRWRLHGELSPGASRA